MSGQRGPGRHRVVGVMPAYNAAATLERTCRDIPAGSVDEVVLVDDGSRDQTVAVARALGLTVIEHGENRGYGANQKTCYDEALRRGADIVVMIHPDYQYDSHLTPLLTGFIEATGARHHEGREPRPPDRTLADRRRAAPRCGGLGPRGLRRGGRRLAAGCGGGRGEVRA